MRGRRTREALARSLALWLGCLCLSAAPCALVLGMRRGEIAPLGVLKPRCATQCLLCFNQSHLRSSLSFSPLLTSFLPRLLVLVALLLLPLSFFVFKPSAYPLVLRKSATPHARQAPDVDLGTLLTSHLTPSLPPSSPSRVSAHTLRLRPSHDTTSSDFALLSQPCASRLSPPPPSWRRSPSPQLTSSGARTRRRLTDTTSTSRRLPRLPPTQRGRLP